jgi:UDP-N-acetylmuramate--alanine ligase
MLRNTVNSMGQRSEMAARWDGRRLHFVGVGGCGMSGLALVAAQLGAEVSGSDAKRSIFTDSLDETGLVSIQIGQSADNVPASGEIVYSSAIRPDNVERATARARGIRELHRSALLAELTRMNRTIAVAGAHGKTTTSALLAYVLDQAGLRPTYIIGGLLRKPAVHARAGGGELLVIEADESDRSLLEYDVDIALITNVDLDHVGDSAGYKTTQDVAEILARFAKGAGQVIGSRQAAAELSGSLPALQVAEPAEVAGHPASFVLDGESYDVSLPGWHNCENAALVVRTATLLGCTPQAIGAALRSFPGLARRFDLRGQMAAGVPVYDDYAHHPAEVAAALKAARSLAAGRVVAVFQPHLFSRTQQFTREFADALTLADVVYLEPVYPAREDPADWGHVSARDIAAAAEPGGANFRYRPVRSELAAQITAEAQPDDLVILIGAGDITALADQLVS